jgi:hypothetical protein
MSADPGPLTTSMHIEQEFRVAAGRHVELRIRYYNIQADRFSWRSMDGGQTWTNDFERTEAHRIGPPLNLRPFTPAMER